MDIEKLSRSQQIAYWFGALEECDRQLGVLAPMRSKIAKRQRTKVNQERVKVVQNLERLNGF